MAYMQISDAARQKLVELADDQESDLSVSEIAQRAGVDFDTAMEVIVDHLAATGGSLLPRIRRRAERDARTPGGAIRIRVRTWSLF